NKVYLLLGELHETYKTILNEEKNLNAVFNEGKSGKISKGENYMGLPYAILDYPAVFKKENVFAIRTMFWWGNFFSITLHISGSERMQEINIHKLLKNLLGMNFFLCVNENQWEHDFNRTNYLPASKISGNILAEISSNNFLKISKRIDLQKWDEAPAFLEKGYRELMEIIKANFLTGEKVL
ncbi:MAG: hypothetical protein M3015_11820, partial [Bacteroidota bacterium]|nr:hypothetical protein [Bacteroidota bacterium]